MGPVVNRELFRLFFQADDGEDTESRFRRDFSSGQGAFSQEYFVYLKRKQRSRGGKAPEAAEGDSPEFAF